MASSYVFSASNSFIRFDKKIKIQVNKFEYYKFIFFLMLIFQTFSSTSTSVLLFKIPAFPV